MAAPGDSSALPLLPGKAVYFNTKEYGWRVGKVAAWHATTGYTVCDEQSQAVLTGWSAECRVSSLERGA